MEPVCLILMTDKCSSHISVFTSPFSFCLYETAEPEVYFTHACMSMRGSAQFKWRVSHLKDNFWESCSLPDHQ